MGRPPRGGPWLPPLAAPPAPGHPRPPSPRQRTTAPNSRASLVSPLGPPTEAVSSTRRPSSAAACTRLTSRASHGDARMAAGAHGDPCAEARSHPRAPAHPHDAGERSTSGAIWRPAPPRPAPPRPAPPRPAPSRLAPPRPSRRRTMAAAPPQLRLPSCASLSGRTRGSSCCKRCRTPRSCT